MRIGKTKIFILALFLTLLLAGPVHAEEGVRPPKPGKKDKCPVCGMFAYKYPDWVASVDMGGGKWLYFDGAKDMFKFIFEINRYGQGASDTDVRAMHVTGYYDLEPIKARDAFYVIGSDVYGPMGRELVPFASMEEAREFMLDHKGRRVLRFVDVDAELVRGLDE